MGYSYQGRSRSRAASIKQSFADFRIDEDDTFPNFLIDFVESLPEQPDGANEEVDKRPAKRAKTKSESSYIPVFRDELSFSASYDEPWHAPRQSTLRPDVGAYLKFSLTQSESLTILSRQRYQGRTVRAVFPLDHANNSEATKLVLQVAEKSATAGAEPFWTSVDLRLTHEDGRVTLRLLFELRWNESDSVSAEFHTETQRALRDRVLHTFFSDTFSQMVSSGTYNQQSQSPQDFYEAAFVTEQGDVGTTAMYIPDLTAKLYPFQRRAVQWLLDREGVRWAGTAADNTPVLLPVQDNRPTDLSTHFFECKDASNNSCYISNLFGVATKDLTPFEKYDTSIRGGILSEEMGLGKTVEMIGLILLHRRPAGPPIIFDESLGAQARPTPATLIVTPPSLKSQWLSELSRHAPHLRVMVYSGIGKSCKEEASEAALVNKLAEQDVVVTTYSELKNELHFALEPPTRSKRYERKHHRPKSPLVQLSWWRVCLDEAQEIESGVSNTATLARLIPRVNAWGITGTPVKDTVKDLWGLLLFLHYDPYSSLPRVWQQLTTSHKETFRSLFNRISIRHTKRLVRDELALPSQKRYVITMPFTAIEEQHYQSLFQQMAQACGLDTQGVPLRDDFDPEDTSVLEAMRTALNRLRQTALHPEVGARNRRALGHKSGPLRTVVEVLDAMIEQSENAIIIDRRALLSSQLMRGQFHENSPRVKEALAIWEGVLRESDVLVQESREQLKIEIEQAKSSEDGNREIGQEEDEEDVEKAVSSRVGEAQRRLRYALEIQHKAVFFCANAHFQIKTNEDMTQPDSDDFKRLEKLEVDGYERAKMVRREILQDSHGKASRLMERISAAALRQAFAAIPEIKLEVKGGLEIRPIVGSLEELSDALNEQTAQLDEWREQVVQLVLKELVDEDDNVEITGDEYSDSTKVQEDLIAYITALRATIADRQAALSGQSISTLSDDDIKLARRLARQGDGPSPEKMLMLLGMHDEDRRKKTVGSLRGVLTELRDLSARLQGPALKHLNMERDRIQRILSQHTKLITALEKELDQFTNAMNARVEYYRQLQSVSDQVAAYEGPTDDVAWEALLREEQRLVQKMAASEAKHRYLLHLKETDTKEEQRMCVICQSPFIIGVLTVCGHQFCKDCITLWWKAHHNCPVCKRRLQAANLHDITLKPQELKVHTESSGHPDQSNYQGNCKSKKTGIYADFSSEKLAEIKNIDLPGPSFTTKVDTLVRHLLWLRTSDPGSKSIVFSQYPDFLQVLGMAFSRHQIGYTAFNDRNGIKAFKEDPAIECFLLHARAHSSGLNLVNASHVILCEPLLNTALELQAIARVDRIGQEHETTVWLYIVDGTVEESIYNLSVQRRMEHMGRNLKGKSKESTPEVLDSNLEVANSLEMQQANLSRLMGKGKMAGEQVAKGDLWTCLFGNVSRSRDVDEDQLRNDPTVRRYLAAEAAEERRGNAW